MSVKKLIFSLKKKKKREEGEEVLSQGRAVRGAEAQAVAMTLRFPYRALWGCWPYGLRDLC